MDRFDLDAQEPPPEIPHVVGCPEWAKAWEAHWGRENLDAVTLANLDDMKKRPRACCCTLELPFDRPE